MSKRIVNVKSVTYNWHQNGSVTERDGAGVDWERVIVGQAGCTKIFEIRPTSTTGVNYLAHFEDGSTLRIFNPNLVEYFPAEFV